MTARKVMAQVFGEGHEFRRGDTETTYRTAALALLGKGFNVDEAATVLGVIWSATSAEYGA